MRIVIIRLLARLLGWLFLLRMAASALEETVENAKRIVETEAMDSV